MSSGPRSAAHDAPADLVPRLTLRRRGVATRFAAENGGTEEAARHFVGGEPRHPE